MRTFIMLFCVLSLLSLSACVTAPYGLYEDERSLSTIADDTALVAAVKGRLMDEHFGEGFSASVYCFKGHVFLVGYVAPNFRKRAVDIAKSTGGVQKVTSYWFAKDQDSTTQDMALQLDVNMALIDADGISSTQIELVVHNAEVILLGVVENKAMADKVVSVVKAVPGVRLVRSFLLT